MGQPVTVVEKRSAIPGVLRYETNRVLTGMDHEVFRAGDEIVEDRWAARLAKRILDHGGVASVSMNANVITVKLADGQPPAGLRDVIEELFLYYTEGVVPEVPTGAES